MRKRIIKNTIGSETIAEPTWLNLEDIIEVEVTSEDSSYPIESALVENGAGWRAAESGKQIIRLLFDRPQRVRLIRLSFIENILERTQEYALRWSDDGGETFCEIVRQQWNFSPNGATSQTEDHHVDLAGLTVLELCITPDLSGLDAHASLAQLRIA